MPLDAAIRRSFSQRFDAIRQLSVEVLVPEEDRWKLSIKDLIVGGFLRFEDKTWIVKRAGNYFEFSEDFNQKKKYNWTELRLFCIETGETKNIEWEIDDDIEITITINEIDFQDLRDDEGGEIDEDDLDEMSEKEWSIFFQDKEFRYDDDYAAKYYRDFGNEDGEKVYMYDFKSDDNRIITIEEWGSGSGDESYEIYVSRIASEDEFEILAKGDGDGNG